jgi:hypothetical protein
MNEKTLKIVGYIARSIWFIVKIMLVCVVVISLMVVGYTIARDSANVYIIATDGMKVRAGVVIADEDSAQLYKYFTGTFVADDAELNNSRYEDYLIRDFEYKIKVKSLWCNPWDGTAEIVVDEAIPDIDGEKPASNDNEKPLPPPEWPRREFKLSLVNTDDKWLIDSITILDHLDPEPTPTDEPEISPTPEGMTPSPNPNATSTPVVTPAA